MFQTGSTACKWLKSCFVNWKVQASGWHLHKKTPTTSHIMHWNTSRNKNLQKWWIYSTVLCKLWSEIHHLSKSRGKCSETIQVMIKLYESDSAWQRSRERLWWYDTVSDYVHKHGIRMYKTKQFVHTGHRNTHCSDTLRYNNTFSDEISVELCLEMSKEHKRVPRV